VLLLFRSRLRSEGALKNVRILFPAVLGNVREMSRYEEELELKLGLTARSFMVRISSGEL
jgi:hypothetical protein